MKTSIPKSFDHIIENPQILEKIGYKTPYFLIDKAKIINNINEFYKLFPKSTVYYAMKANSEPEVLKTVADAGTGFEVASYYELELLKKIKVAPEKIIYGTSVKAIEHIKKFVEYGVKTYACDSIQEIEKIASVAPGAKIYVRTVANDSGSVFKFSEKFGIDQKGIIPLLIYAKKLGLIPYGISFHVGSQASEVKAWANALLNLHNIISELINIGITIEMINFGGGYPCKYLGGDNIPSLSEIAKFTLLEYKKLPVQPKIYLEPGRGIIADAVIAVTSVIARVERSGNTWLFLDLGVYNGLFETMAYQGSTRYAINSLRHGTNAGESLFELAGPTGDSPDVITREALLPTDINVGDKLIVHNCGAYSLSVTSTFNGFPKPQVYCI